jgi:hypothetical protein
MTFHERGVTFLFHFDENVTVAARMESAKRIRDLDFRDKQPLAAARRVPSPGPKISNQFRCRLRRMVYSLIARGAHDL